MKKFFLILLIFFVTSITALGLNLSDFYKIYPLDSDTLFMKALFAINSKANFEVFEIQTKNGYILFSYSSKYYLLTVTKRYQNQSEIKILPQNSDFSQGNIVPLTIFGAIDSELKTKIEEVK